MMRDDLDILLQISRWQRQEAKRLGITIPSILDRKPQP